MAYSVLAPNRINGPEAWIDIEGAADNPPAGYTAIYLLDCRLYDWLGERVPVEVKFSYLRGTVPALTGIDGQPWVQYTPAWIHLILPVYPLPTGDYRFCFTLETTSSGAPALGSGEIQQFELGLFIAQPPLALPYGRPPVPGLLVWHGRMVELADRWEKEILDPANQLGEQNWYYDVASTYWQIGDYLHQSNRYAQVALNSAAKYEQYVRDNNGSILSHKAFGRGLRQCYERTQETHWIDTLEMLTGHGWVHSGGDIDPANMRETAYAVDIWRELVWVGRSDANMLRGAIARLLGQMNLLYAQEYRRDDGMVNEPMFFGLAAQALIDCYDLERDPRIPEALMAGARYIWDKAVDQETGFVRYNIFEPQTDWFTGLNLMMTNAWGFLYGVTANDLYRRQGDILFEHVFDDGAWNWSAKQFAQIYRRSIDYVTRWRA